MNSLDALNAQLAAVLAQKAAPEKLLLDSKRQERDDAIALIVSNMHEHGVVLGELKAPSAIGKGRASRPRSRPRLHRSSGIHRPARHGPGAACSHGGPPPLANGAKLKQSRL